MNSAIHAIPRSSKAIRTIAFINFLLVGLFVVPITHRLVDRFLRALQRIKLENLIGRSLQVWIVGSTFLATALFARNAIKSRWAADREGSSKSSRLDGVLLLAWWLTVMCFIAYGFMLGMGG